MIAITHLSLVDKSRIAKALEYQKVQTLDEVLQFIERGVYVALRASDSTLTIMQEPEGIHINQMAGKKSDIDEILSSLVEIAKDLNKQYITLEGRKGWSRLLKPYGFKQAGKRLRYKV